MAIETTTTIAGLNALWPLGSDPRSEGDDHIRLIKSVLKSTDGGALTGATVTVVTSTGSWTKPAGLKMVEVTVVGGGGGSGAAAATAAGQSSCSTGGGGAGTVIKLYKASDLGASVAMTIGAQGSSAPTAGGTSSFGSLSAGGGGAGQLVAANTTFTTSSGGAGGSASGGDLNVNGEFGGWGVRMAHGTTAATAGAGGGSLFAMRLPEATYNVQQTAQSGNIPGGGARGALNGASQALTNGAGAGPGRIYLKEYF